MTNWYSKRYPLKMCIPPDRASRPGLTLPNGQWERLADGSIDVTFRSAEEVLEFSEITKILRKEK